MKIIIVFLVKVYQCSAGRILPPACRFYPTCSNYLIDAVTKRGALAGLLLGIWRLLRCNPFGGSGYDPVKN